MDASPPRLRSLRATRSMCRWRVRIRRLAAWWAPPRSCSWTSKPTRDWRVTLTCSAGQARIAAACRTPIQLGANLWGTRPDQEPFSGCLGRRHARRHEDLRDYGLVAGGQPSGGSRFTGVESPVPGTQRAAAGGFAASPLAQVPGLAAPILHQPLEVKDGFPLPQKAAGCGSAWDKDAVGVTGFARRAHPP